MTPLDTISKYKSMDGKLKIGIIGVGFVGGAVQFWFEREGVKTYRYDKYKNIGSPAEVNKADIIFICVPTPFTEKKGYDDRAVKEALRILKKGKIVVIKSTIIPGSTEKYQKMFPRHAILFNPEFLVARTANLDFINPDRQIIGYTKKSKKYAKTVLLLLPKAPFERFVPAIDAEMIKYFGNTFLSTRVIFANQMYDLCQKIGASYDIVKECAGADRRIGTSHFDVFHDGGRGYSGACLPKDTRAIIQLGKKAKSPLPLLEKVEEINNKLVKKFPKRA